MEKGAIYRHSAAVCDVLLTYHELQKICNLPCHLYISKLWLAKEDSLLVEPRLKDEAFSADNKIVHNKNEK